MDEKREVTLEVRGTYEVVPGAWLRIGEGRFLGENEFMFGSRAESEEEARRLLDEARQRLIEVLRG